MDCIVSDKMNLLGKKWTAVILEEIYINEKAGFNKILARMKKISPKQLSKSLKEMENQNLICKNIVKDNPLRTSYKLTKSGNDLYKVVLSIKKLNKHVSGKKCAEKYCTECEFY